MLREGGRPGLEISRQYFSYETYALALPRDDGAFRLVVDRTLARLYRTGKINAILEKTFGKAPLDELLEGHDRHQLAAGPIDVKRAEEACRKPRQSPCDDRGRSGRGRDAGAWHRHDLRPAGRAERSSVRGAVQGRRPDADGPHPPRTGRGLYGARRGARDRQAARLCGGAGAGPAQLLGRTPHRLFDERAGAGADRRNPRRRHRAASWPPARNPRPGRHHQAAGRSFGADPQARTGAASGRRGDALDGVRPARPGLAAMRDRRLGQDGDGDAAGAAAGARAHDRRDRDPQGREASGRGEKSDDRLRRRRAGCVRGGAPPSPPCCRRRCWAIAAAAACSTAAIRSASRCRSAAKCGARPMWCSASARAC